MCRVACAVRAFRRSPPARPPIVASATAAAAKPVPHTNGVLLVLQASLAADANAAVMRVVTALGPNDLVGVIAYASEPWVVASRSSAAGAIGPST